MKVRIKKTLLKESVSGQDLGYTDVENVRISIGAAIDRAVLTPDDGSEINREAEDSMEMKEKDYINRIRDVVKSGRKVPYLYYAYKGVNDQGDLMNNNDITPVLELQVDKAVKLAQTLEWGGDASVDMFKCDFGSLMSLHGEWDENYEATLRSSMPTRTYDRLALKKGYDRAEFQAGRATKLLPFSTVAIGRGSKPLYAQNVDFMYKTSPEPNLNVDPQDLWAFSIRVPLYLAYTILTGFDVPRGRKTRQQRKALMDDRYLNITPKKIIDAYNHWTQNEQAYREKYATIMKQEPNSWAQYMDVSTVAKSIKLNLTQFNHNYVESERSATKKSKIKPDALDRAKPEFWSWYMLIQPPPLELYAQEGLLDDLDNPETSKKIANQVANLDLSIKDRTMKNNYITNLIQLFENFSDDRAIQNNKDWFITFLLSLQINSEYIDKIVIKHFRDHSSSEDLEKLIQNATEISQPNNAKIINKLRFLIENYKDEPGIKENLPWLYKIIQKYYAMGGQ